MLVQAIGAVLPAAPAVALSPFPLIGCVLILAGRHRHRNGPLFAAGWVAGLALVATLIVVLFGGADDPHSPSSATADWGGVFAGAALIVLGVRKWYRRPRDADSDGMTDTTPRWMAHHRRRRIRSRRLLHRPRRRRPAPHRRTARSVVPGQHQAIHGLQQHRQRDETYRLAKASVMPYRPPHGFPVKRPAPTA
ncbi:GAP family protein [Streptomyces sp. M41]|uniref:GAP family protein n=1 Tax=Streptomyces sp. M41 TaxID=3059412 RepID=UPI00374D6ED2